ncbi:hypothetical protein FRACYDRAFT_267630 [Fragilariopsis cylindrus CCMP1102]|uniref:Uncharacterized protein n=1 Tax=Fragilariopsis cylindrus CCMP1102 TaxID=635003 RepID=A0A1E7FQJ9_9STRA|nr:hypothetical protein FRACYDRAFT_267630 [Fragilariopsis cylindrus CCMP1102]|eukprot:OEU20426.1 hypothetical protein FRACYDRAFT_267630 [Fragilariopsis cylindrus CCMP1102]
MVAVAPNNSKLQVTANNAGLEEQEKVSPKQLKRLEEQKANEAKKMAKRQAKALQKERKTTEKENKEADRERKAEEDRLLNQGLCAKEMEEKQRQDEEAVLLEEFLREDPKKVQAHTKKSASDSNRLGVVLK